MLDVRQNSNCAVLGSTAKECPQDLDFDNDIDTEDLLILLGNWGYCPEGETCWSDIDMDGDVDTADLLDLLGVPWGLCPPAGAGGPAASAADDGSIDSSTSPGKVGAPRR